MLEKVTRRRKAVMKGLLEAMVDGLQLARIEKAFVF